MYFGRGLYGVARKTSNPNPLAFQKKASKNAVDDFCLSSGFLLGDNRNGHRCGAENAADTLTVELCKSSCSRETPTFITGSNVYDKENVAGCFPYSGFKAYSLSSHTRPQLRRTSYVSSSALRRQGLCCRHGQLWFSRAYSGDGTRSEPLHRTKTGYYEVLEVSPTATQAQVKTAYYKQSFIYHPDRNPGSETATNRFSEISEAYMVLGSKALRRKYDRGLLTQSDLTATARPSADTTGSPAKQQPGSRRSVAGQGTGRGVFDFDTFYESHYSEQLQKQRDIKYRKEEMLKKKEKSGEDRLSSLLEMGVGVLLLFGLGLLLGVK